MLLLAARVASLRAGDQANPPGMQMDREDASELRPAEEFHRGDTAAYALHEKVRSIPQTSPFGNCCRDFKPKVDSSALPQT